MASKVIIKYVDDTTSEELVNSVVYDEVNLGKQTYYPQSLYGYNVVGDSFQDVFLTEDGEIKTITFKYKKIIETGSITIKYIDSTSLKDLAEPLVIENLELGSYLYSALSIAGYELDGESSITITLTDDNFDKIGYFRYKKIIGSVTVRFVDEDTLQDIVPEEIIDSLNLGINQIFAINIENYTLNAITPQVINLTDYNNNETVIFKYKKTLPLGTITAQYIDTITLNDLLEPSIYKDLNLGTHTISKKSIAGYIIDGQDSQEVTLTEDNLNETISFKYKEVRGSVTVKFIDADTENEVKSPRISEDLDLGLHSFIALEIDGYELIGAHTQVILLTELEPSEEIIFKYKKIKQLGSFTVKYIRESNSAELETETINNDLEFGEYSYSALSIAGYTIIGSDSQKVILTEENPNQTITFLYQKIVGTVTVRFIDEDTLDDILQQETIDNLNLGITSFIGVDIEGYTLVTPSPIVINLTDLDYTETVIFKYKKV